MIMPRQATVQTHSMRKQSIWKHRELNNMQDDTIQRAFSIRLNWKQ